jgi:hypothetical protein
MITAALGRALAASMTTIAAMKPARCKIRMRYLPEDGPLTSITPERDTGHVAMTQGSPLTRFGERRLAGGPRICQQRICGVTGAFCGGWLTTYRHASAERCMLALVYGLRTGRDA